ncbi:MAG: tetratricopeptide repeat protein [Balneolaceae bacterium]
MNYILMMSNKTFLLALLVCFLPLNEVEAIQPTGHCDQGVGYEEVMNAGLEAFYRTRWETAEACFERLHRLNSLDPRGLFFSSMIPFWNYYFAGREPEIADHFMEQSERAILLAEERLEERDEDLYLISLLSALYGYQSLVASEEGRIRRALQSGRTGYKYTQQILAMKDDRPELEIGRGIFHYMIGSIPGSLRWLVSLFGLNGSREEGLDHLERAAGSNSYVRFDAMMVLSRIYAKEEKYELAQDYAEKLVRERDENIIFQYLYADLLKTNGQETEALVVYRKIAEMEPGRLGLLVERSLNRIEEIQKDLSYR